MWGSLILFAALAAAAEPPPPPSTVSPLVVSPARTPPPADGKVQMPSSDEAIGKFVAVWPADAYHTQAHGQVRLACRIEVHGLAEWCRVVTETPPGKGFGQAALQLRPTFKLPPKVGADGQPIAAVMNLDIEFQAEAPQVDTRRMVLEIKRGSRVPMDFELRHNPLPMRDINMLSEPVWAEAASFEDLAAAYPAKGAGEEGYAAAHCEVHRKGPEAGTLGYCFIIKETPDGGGFGPAALGLAKTFRVAPASLDHAPRGALWVDIPIRFPPPGSAELAARTVAAPVWLTGFDPIAAPKVYPPEAIAQGLTSGRGVARCTVAADGALGGCTPEPGQPDGVGFSEAVAKLAATMRMNLWSGDAAPVRGGIVRVAMRLNLKGAN